MFKCLEKLDSSVVSRYLTLERNIKSYSKSYYDSYLDLLETTLKNMLEVYNIDYDSSRTCGWLLKNDSVISMIKDINLDSYSYEKLIDYTKKINDHKHKQEKNITIDAIINQLRIYHNLVKAFISKKYEQKIDDFDPNYYVSIFGLTEKQNKQYLLECENLKVELSTLVNENKLSKYDIEKYKSLLSYKDIELLDLDEQNQKLQEEISILKDIKLNSMEEKLNRTIDILVDMQEFLFESRIVSYKIASRIDGSYREELAEATKKLEEIKSKKIER